MTSNCCPDPSSCGRVGRWQSGSRPAWPGPGALRSRALTSVHLLWPLGVTETGLPSVEMQRACPWARPGALLPVRGLLGSLSAPAAPMHWLPGTVDALFLHSPGLPCSGNIYSLRFVQTPVFWWDFPDDAQEAWGPLPTSGRRLGWRVRGCGSAHSLQHEGLPSSHPVVPQVEPACPQPCRVSLRLREGSSRPSPAYPHPH